MKLFDVLLCPLARVRIINVPAETPGDAVQAAEAWLNAQPDLVAREFIKSDKIGQWPRDATQRMAYYDLMEDEPIHMALVDVVGDAEHRRSSWWIRSYEGGGYIEDPRMALPQGMDFAFVAARQGWNDRSQLEIALRFITARGLEKELTDYALRVANTENAEAAHV